MKSLIDNTVYRNIWERISVKDQRGEAMPEDLLECLPAENTDIIRYANLYSGDRFRMDEIQLELEREFAFGADDRAPLADKDRNSGPQAVPNTNPPLQLTGVYQSTSYTTENIPVNVSDGCPIPYSGGFDGGTEISLYGDFYPDDNEKRVELFARLDYCKKKSRQDKNQAPINLDGRIWLVEPYGVGSKSFFGRFKYILKSGGVTLTINEEFQKDVPIVRIIYGYDALFGKDLKTEHNELLRILKNIGLMINEEKISRVDLQVTLNTPFKLVEYAYQNDCIISRVRKWSHYAENQNDTLNLGTIRGGQDLQICIYDKQAECQATGNMEKFENCLRASGQETLDLTRVEYRIRRRVLNAMRIDTVDDLYKALPDLIEFLTGAWFRILNEPKIRGHENEQELSGFWKMVQCAFRDVFCEGKRGNSAKITINKIRVVNAHKLTRQGMGCLVQAVASATFRYAELDPTEFMLCITTILKSNLNEFYESYQQKRKMLKILRTKDIQYSYFDSRGDQ